ncbi:MSC_0621 family F1-like ATPase epsilon subunit [Mycoplasma sp. Ms02]|uniref:MSC_0621 family F1-like ATPase epsilon subunit n=1 Tax=Mycoplasma sp. Ms02 TaxID=353851 RepID=UPI001C8ADA6C|nr:hypothetical protein [Mycoplasma sp. Ms02]QZE12325.1 hypothetical protein K4L35_03260 [Mycoplasma sp. Ms02]
MEIRLISQENETTKFFAKSLELNINFFDQWVKLKKDSIASYKTCFFRINTEENETLYFYLNNVFITYREEYAEVLFNDNLVIYEQVKKVEETLKEKKKAIRQFNKDLFLYNSLKETEYKHFNEHEMLKKQFEAAKNKVVLDFNLVERK